MRAAAAALLFFAGLSPAMDDVGFFDKQVAPILRKRCLACHNNELNDGGVSFQDRATLIKGGSRGPAIVPGKPGQSVIIHAIRQDAELKMPPGKPLTKRDISVLTKWIERGAVWGSPVR